MGSEVSQGPSLPSPRRVTLGKLLTSQSICSSVKSGQQQTPGDRGGQRTLVGYSPWVLKESDTT